MKQLQGKTYGKLVLDLILLVLLALMYQKRVISMRFHELGGLVLIGLFLLHKALNWTWIRSVTSGILHRRVKLNALWLVDALLLLSMTAVLVTGLLISKTLPTALEGAFFLKPLHYFFAALAIVLTGIHLGLHWPLLRGSVWNKLPLKGHARTATGAVLLCVVMGAGAYALATTSILSWFSQPFFGRMPMADGMHGEAHGELEGRKLPEGFERPDGETADTEFPASEGAREEGNRKGMGRGPGKGMGKGDMEMQKISPMNVLGTAATYASVVLFAAVITAAVHARLLSRRRKRAEGTA